MVSAPRDECSRDVEDSVARPGKIILRLLPSLMVRQNKLACLSIVLFKAIPIFAGKV